jgi:hypothetical protein
MNEKNQKDMELRSEKVRNIVGQIPPYLLRTGVYMISIILLALLLISCLVSYREYETVPAELHCRPAHQTGKMLESGNFYIVAPRKHIYEKQCIGYIEDGTNSTIRFYSHLNGEITYNCQNGDYLNKGDVIFSIIPDSINQILAISHISSHSISKIKINQDVIFYSPNGDSMKGYISHIYPVKTVDRTTNAASYKVEATLNHDRNVDVSQIGIIYNMKILISKKTLLKKILPL